MFKNKFFHLSNKVSYTLLLSTSFLTFSNLAEAQTTYFWGRNHTEQSVYVNQNALDALGEIPVLPGMVRPVQPSAAYFQNKAEQNKVARISPSGKPVSGLISSIAASSALPRSGLTQKKTPQNPIQLAKNITPKKSSSLKATSNTVRTVPAAPPTKLAKQPTITASAPKVAASPFVKTVPNAVKSVKPTVKTVTSPITTTTQTVAKVATKAPKPITVTTKPQPKPKTVTAEKPKPVAIPTATTASAPKAAEQPRPAPATVPKPAAVPTPAPSAAKPKPAPVPTSTQVKTAEKTTAPAPKQTASLPRTLDPKIVKQQGNLVSILFDATATDLPNGAKPALDNLVTRLKEDENLTLLLEGYALIPNAGPNQSRRMSLFRAISVRNYLVKQDIHSRRIKVRAYGNKADGNERDRVDVFFVQN